MSGSCLPQEVLVRSRVDGKSEAYFRGGAYEYELPTGQYFFDSIHGCGDSRILLLCPQNFIVEYVMNIKRITC